MSKGFLDYLTEKQDKKRNKIVEKPQEKINEKLELGNTTNILEKAENERNVSLKEEQKNNLNSLEHAMLIYEGLKDQPRKGTTIISDDISDPLAHATMLM